jgi:hypothetical protein
VVFVSDGVIGMRQALGSVECGSDVGRWYMAVMGVGDMRQRWGRWYAAVMRVGGIRQ